MKKRFYIALLALFAAVGNAFSQSMTISGGNDHGLIICAQGYLYTWGNNMGSTGGPYLGIDPTDPKYGGLAGDKFVTLPAQVKTNNLTFSQVTAGSGAFNLALSCHKVVYAWGDNNSGACGQGTGVGNTVKFPVPVLKGETSGYTEDGKPGGDYLGGVKWVAGSTNQGFAITEDDRVVCWGKPGWSGGSWINPPLDVNLPSYVRDKAGNIIENVTHISGGDDNVYMRTADGKLYSIGNCNGNSLTSGTAVNYAVQVLKSDGTPLDNIRMSAAGDKCGFAVTNDGFLWGWGDSWGGCPGIAPDQGSGRAQKVSAGDYKVISGEAYLTDVTQVIGGRGHGAAITKEGYLLYWGVNDGSNGGVAPDPKATAKSTNGNPIFAFYCKEGTCDQRGDTVKNAVAISRGDNFDFMVNDKDEYYAWGLNDLGQLGIGNKCDLVQCLKKIETIPCEIQDVCPSVFMIDINKCPGEEIELDCGYVVPIGKEDRYYIEWYYNDEKLNTSDIKKGAAGNYIYDRSYDSDPYNKAKILITKPGRYKVIAYYVGANIPCDACEPSEVEIEVNDMAMPVDTVITNMNCVVGDDKLRPAKTDVMCYEAVVNDNFYKKATDKVTFAAFATPDSKDTLTSADKPIIINTTGNGGTIEFCVTGDQIKDIEDRSGEIENDTLFNVWIEDITQYETTLLEKNAPTTAAGNYYGSFTQIISMTSPAELKSFSIFAAGQQMQPGTLVVTPIILRGGSETNSGYTLGSVYAKGTKQTFTLNKEDGVQECKVICDMVLPVNSARGSEYILAAEITINNGGFYTEKLAPAGDGSNSVMYGTPYLDSEKFGIKAIGSTSNGLTTANPGRDNIFWNITFGKMTDYDCGRIKLSARFGCPPCKSPDLDKNGKRVSIVVNAADADKNAKGDKVLELCKETPKASLNIIPLKEGGVAAGNTFDVLWFDQFDDLSDTKAIEKGNVASLVHQVEWADIVGTATDTEEDIEKTFYVMVKDHEKPGCEYYDSIKVIAHPVPLDTLKWIEFCVGMLEDEPTFEIAGKTINWVTAPTDVMNMEASASFDYTVTDDVTGCEGPVQTLKITVNSTEAPTLVKTLESVVMDATKHYSLSAAIDASAVCSDCTIKWYDSEIGTTPLTSTQEDISLGIADTYEFWAEQVNTETGCVSERVKFTLVVNDAPVPDTKNENLCIDETIDLKDYVSATQDGNTYDFLWYKNLDDAKGVETLASTSFTSSALNVGSNKFYVSQKNRDTGAESEKAEIVITVHAVATLDLSANVDNYCIGEVGAKGEEFVFTPNADGDFTSVVWSDNSSFAGPKPNWTPDIDAEGVFTYYVKPIYTNVPTLPTVSTTCEGAPQFVTITVNKTPKPTSDKNFTIQYMKDQQPFVPARTQESTAVIPASPTHTIKWYKDDGVTETTEPTPPAYGSTDSGDKRYTYYVSQVDPSTGCESEKEKVTLVVSGYPMPEVEGLRFCQPTAMSSITGTLVATITPVTGGSPIPASDFSLVWYDKNPDVDPSAGELTSIDLATYAAEFESFTGKEFKRQFYVRQRHISHTTLLPAQSAVSVLEVTVYARPQLATHNAAPICDGEKTDLAKLYEVSNEVILKVNANYADALNNIISGNSLVDKAGTYQVQGYFDIAETGQRCESDWEKVKVTVDELEFSIDGDPTTCPGVAVDLKPIVTTNVTDRPITYDWNTTANVTQETENFNTTVAGLAATGDRLTVTLKVQAGACTNMPAVSHVITVGDGPVSASLKFTERENAQTGKSYTVNDKVTGPSFASCNGAVTVNFSDVLYTDANYTFDNGKGHSGTGVFSPSGSDFGAKVGTYVITYTNQCPTQFVFTIKDVSISLEDENRSKLDICEGDEFWSQLTINKASSDPISIEWTKTPTGVTPATPVVLPQTDEKLLIKPAQVTDSGIYSFKVSNDNCSFSGEVATGLPLKVKPKVKVNSSLVNHYEVTREGDMTMSIPFDVPATPTDVAAISSGIKWMEDGVATKTGDVVIESSVMNDHHYNVVIDHPDYCGTNFNVDLLVDALLQLNVSLDETDMCINENHILTIDTTGTGNVLHPDKLTFKVEEVVDGVATQKSIPSSRGSIQMTVSPAPTSNMKVEYKVTYTYSGQTPAQDESKSAYITVHPAYKVEWTIDEPNLCEGEGTYINITTHEPDDINLEWVPDVDIVSSSSYSAQVIPVFTSTTSYSQRKRYTLIATSEYCRPKEYYPEIVVDKPLEGTIEGLEYSCEGSPLVLDASSYHATSYEWYSTDQLGDKKPTGEKLTVVPIPEYAEFFVDMVRGACKATDSHSTIVTFAPKIDYIDSLTYRKIEVVLVSGTGTAPFQYIIDGNMNDENLNSSVKDVEYGKHELVIIDDAKCKVTHNFYVNSPLIVLQKEISPNGDGVNDRFYSQVLADAYPNAVVRVFDRWGKEVAKYSAGDNEGWDGTYNGNNLPSTDYWYEIQIEEIQKTYVGHFTLLRQ